MATCVLRTGGRQPLSAGREPLPGGSAEPGACRSPPRRVTACNGACAQGARGGGVGLRDPPPSFPRGGGAVTPGGGSATSPSKAPINILNLTTWSDMGLTSSEGMGGAPPSVALSLLRVKARQSRMRDLDALLPLFDQCVDEGVFDHYLTSISCQTRMRAT